MRERHAEHAVTGLQHGEVGRLVGRRARVGLHVDVVGAEQLERALDGERLDLVDDLAAAVVAVPGEALRVLVGEHRPHGLQHGVAREVLAGDHLQGLALPVGLGAQQARDRRVDVGDVLREVAVVVDEAHSAGPQARVGSTPRVHRHRGRTTRTPTAASARATPSGSGPGRIRTASPPPGTGAQVNDGRRGAGQRPGVDLDGGARRAGRRARRPRGPGRARRGGWRSSRPSGSSSAARSAPTTGARTPTAPGASPAAAAKRPAGSGHEAGRGTRQQRPRRRAHGVAEPGEGLVEQAPARRRSTWHGCDRGRPFRAYSASMPAGTSSAAASP